MAVVGSSEKTVATVGGVASACKFYAEVKENSTNTANNTSNITVTFKATSLKSSCGYGTLGSPVAYFSVEGSEKSRISVKDFAKNTTISLGSWTGNISHNSDGKKTISVSCTYDPVKTTGYYQYAPVKTTLSFTATLSTIPRYFTSTPTISVSSVTETSVVINWTTSETCSRVQYKLNDNGSWVDVANDANSKSGSYTISGLSANTSYKIYGDYMRRDSGLWSQTKPSVNISTYDYPHPASINDFVIGDGSEVNLYNPLGRYVVLQIRERYSSSVIGEYSGTYNGVVNVEFKTSSAIDAQYRSIPNSQSGQYYAYVLWSGVSERYSSYATYRIRGNEYPNFDTSNWDYVSDGNYGALTGNNNKTIIEGYSGINISLSGNPSSNYYASFSGSNHGFKYGWGDYNSSLKTNTSNSISNQRSKELRVLAFDDRGIYNVYGNSKNISDEYYVSYSKPYIESISTKRKNGIDVETTLSFKGKLGYSGRFGPTGVNNSIDKLYYQVKSGNEEYGNLYEITEYSSGSDGSVTTFEVNDFKIHSNGTSGGFAVGTKYKIRVLVYDAKSMLQRGEAETEVTDGKIARDVYQDSDGNYHQGINGRASADYSEIVHGNFHADKIYGEIETDNIKSTGNFKATGNFVAECNKFAVYESGDMWNSGSIVTSGALTANQGINSAMNSTGIAGSGTSGGKFSFYQTYDSFYGSSADWAHYLIGNHGNGDNYFHHMIRLPFWGVPQYQRMEGGSLKGWQTFITTENIGGYFYPVIGGAIGTGTSSASGYWYTVQTAWLAAGTYIVSALCRWSANGSGYRRATITTDANSDNVDNSVAPSPSGITQVTVTRVMQISYNDTPVYFRMSQNSGSTLTQYCQFNIMRIG